MVKNVNGDIYSDLITVARPETFWSGGERSLLDIRYIVIHGTATTNIVGAYSTWLKSRSNQTSANYLVTDNDIMGCVGENYIAWHSGGTGAVTNVNSIGIEHINSSIGDYNDASTYLFSQRTLENGARLSAEICKRLGLKPDRSTIKMHREVNATACPQTLNIDKYVALVQKYYNSIAETKEKPVAPKKETKRGKNMLVMRSISGKQGYVGIIGDSAFGIGDIRTVTALQEAGFGHATLPDPDFDRIIQAVGLDTAKLEEIAKNLKK